MHIRNQTSLPAPGVVFLHASAHEVAPARGTILAEMTRNQICLLHT